MVTAKKAAKAAASTRKAAPAKRAPRANPTSPKTAKTPSASGAAAHAVAKEKPEKAKKLKLVRDSFTIPKAEYAVIDQLKQRAAQSGTPAKKSELLRAGLKVLAGMDDAAFIAAIGTVPTLKTGRPAKT